MQDVTPTPAGEPKQKNTFRGLFSRMAIGQCVHAALCVAAGAAIGLSAGRVSTALGIVLGILAAAIGAVVCALWFRRRVSRPVEQITEVTRTIAGGRYGTELPVQRDDELGRLATAINELSQEISRRTKNMSRIYAEVGRHAKAVSGGLKTMISPYIHGVKTDQVMAGDKALSVEEHRREWNEILGNVAGAVDILAFQDGQVDYHELYDYLVVNKALADKYGMECWTNIESFDRDMPIRFLPIKWEKLLLKLDAARRDIFTIATAIILKSTTLTGNGKYTP